MKRILAISFLVLLIVGGVVLFQLYKSEYSGVTYYTQIVSEGKKTTETIEGKKDEIINYEYTQLAFDANGNSKLVTFNGNKDEPLRMDAYLKLTVNEKKGVISWEEVKQTEVPAKALPTL